MRGECKMKHSNVTIKNMICMCRMGMCCQFAFSKEKCWFFTAFLPESQTLSGFYFAKLPISSAVLYIRRKKCNYCLKPYWGQIWGLGECAADICNTFKSNCERKTKETLNKSRWKLFAHLPPIFSVSLTKKSSQCDSITAVYLSNLTKNLTAQYAQTIYSVFP